MTICQFESPAEAGSPLWQAGRDRFLEAGRRAQTLTHPRILPVLDVIDEAGEALIASEYVEGETLESALQSKRLSVDEAGAILGQVALALDFAHSRGVVHGDLKPAAIHLSPDGQVKVADFGVSPLAHWDTGRPVPLNRLHEFLSPEFIRDPASVDGRSDQYSLAVRGLARMAAIRLPPSWAPSRLRHRDSTNGCRRRSTAPFSGRSIGIRPGVSNPAGSSSRRWARNRLRRVS
jgi:serine/threonine protein kinase